MTRRFTAIGDEWAVLDGDRVVATCRDFADVARLCPGESAPYVPKRGDVVRYAGLRNAHEDYEDLVLIEVAPDGFGKPDPWLSKGVDSGKPSHIYPTKEWWSYLRDSTDAEKRAAGLLDKPVAAEAKPAPEAGGIVHPNWKIIDGTRKAAEAKRPEWVRIVSTDSDALKTGEVRRVCEWDRNGHPWVEHEAYPNCGHVLIQTKWEPCPPPAPVAPECPTCGSPSRKSDRTKCAKTGIHVQGGCDLCDDPFHVASPTPVPPVDPVREAERAVVEAAEKWMVAYGKDGYMDNGHAERLRLAVAVDALRAARTAKGAS